MWSLETQPIRDGAGIRCTLTSSGVPVRYSDAIDLWTESNDFCEFFSATLAAVSFEAFRWETPPVTTSNADRVFEFVVLRDDYLDRAQDEQTFAAHFAGDSVVTFPNVGGDAVLVVPSPATHEPIYAHLGSFVRHAPQQQRIELWHAVGAAMRSRLSDRPVWLSTAGGGVAWLHLRLDTRPKYYGFAEYRTWP